MSKRGNKPLIQKINRIASEIQKEGGYTEVCTKKPKIKRIDALKRAGKRVKNEGRKVAKPLEKKRKAQKS